MKRRIFSLRRLRWKLTLSYTLVTVVVLLVLELLLVSAVIGFLYSSVPPILISQQMRENLAPRLEEPISGDEPDLREIRAQIERPYTDSGEQGPDINISTQDVPADDPTDFTMFVVDDERELLVSNPKLQRFPEGERFRSESFDGLDPLLRNALNGEGNSAELSGTIDGRYLITTPVEEESGDVAGVVVSTIQLPNLTGFALILVGATAIVLLIPAAFLGMIFGFLTAWGLTRRIGRLAHAADAWSRGDFSVRSKDRSRDELGELSQELNDMAADFENLLQTRQELATLEARNRFARDLHDSVKQQVFATSMQIATARALIAQKPENAEEHLAQAHELVRQAQKELNVLIHEMRPAALEGNGLPQALREYVAGWSKRAEIPAEVHVRGEREIPLEAEQALFRVAQEALANVAKHSEAKKAEIDLVYTSQGVKLLVADDGVGFDPAKNPGEGFGLRSMRDRLVKLGGNVEVESEPEDGATITGSVPLATPEEKENNRSWIPWANR